MKIAQIAPPWFVIQQQQPGETESIISHLVEELHTRGHEVTLFAPADALTSAKKRSFISESLCKERMPWQVNLKAYYHFHKSLDYIAAHDFDIVHSHLSSDGDLYLFPLAAALQKPHVMTLHHDFPFRQSPDLWESHEEDYFTEWTQQIPLVTISDSARRQMQQSLPYIDTIHYGVPMPEHHTGDLVDQDSNQAEGPQGRYVVWMGNFTYEQGAHLAIEAARTANMPLLLIGTKQPESQDAMRYYHHLIEPFIIPHNTRNQRTIVRTDQPARVSAISAVTPQQKASILRQAWALLNPVGTEESSGQHLLEAMATGCPVISFARGVAPEIIEQGQTGFLVPDLPSMIHALSLIDTLDRDTTRNHVERYFSIQTMTENYLHLYNKVVTAHTLSRMPAMPAPLGNTTSFANTSTRRNMLSA